MELKRGGPAFFYLSKEAKRKWCPASFYFVMERSGSATLLFLKGAKRREWASSSIFLRMFNGAKTRWSCLLLSF